MMSDVLMLRSVIGDYQRLGGTYSRRRQGEIQLQIHIKNIKFEGLMAENLSIAVICVMTPCGHIGVFQYFF